MRTVVDHQEAIRVLLAPLARREHEPWAGPASDLRDRVLAVDVISPIDLPPFDNSQMDGYAVRSADVVPGLPLRVAPRIAAGHAVGSLEPGAAAPIMTGAPVPAGADAIIPIEGATPDAFQPEDGEHSVAFASPVEPGSFVRPRGSDLAAGEVLLRAGTRLGPAQAGVLAASGVTEIILQRQLRVLVLSTGDELRAPGESLESGQVYDANSWAMAVAVSSCGAIVTDVVTVSDDAVLVRALLAEKARQADLILTTGGVSKGAYEVVRDVFEGVGVDFDGVAVQPGGPQGLGLAQLTDDDGQQFTVPVVAFPGNPVSALVSFELFLRPVLRELSGLPPHRGARSAPLAEPLDSPAGKHQVRRGRLGANGEVELVGGPSSHLLHGYASSTLLVHVPLGVSHLAAGDPVEVWSIDD